MSALEHIVAWTKNHPETDGMPNEEAIKQLLPIIYALAKNVEGCNLKWDMESINNMWLNPSWKENYLCLQDDFEATCGEDHKGTLEGMHDVLSAAVRPIDVSVEVLETPRNLPDKKSKKSVKRKRK